MDGKHVQAEGETLRVPVLQNPLITGARSSPLPSWAKSEVRYQEYVLYNVNDVWFWIPVEVYQGEVFEGMPWNTPAVYVLDKLITGYRKP